MKKKARSKAIELYMCFRSGGWSETTKAVENEQKKKKNHFVGNQVWCCCFLWNRVSRVLCRRFCLLLRRLTSCSILSVLSWQWREAKVKLPHLCVFARRSKSIHYLFQYNLMWWWWWWCCCCRCRSTFSLSFFLLLFSFNIVRFPLLLLRQPSNHLYTRY